VQETAALRHASAPSGRVPTTPTAGESERKPAAAVERLLIVLSVSEPTPPQPGRPSGHARPVIGRRAADVLRHAIGLLDIGVPPEVAMVVLNQQPAPRRARRDDPIALPSAWVIARIAGWTG
jgi:hypothetical protein